MIPLDSAIGCHRSATGKKIPMPPLKRVIPAIQAGCHRNHSKYDIPLYIFYILLFYPFSFLFPFSFYSNLLKVAMAPMAIPLKVNNDGQYRCHRKTFLLWQSYGRRAFAMPKFNLESLGLILRAH